MTRAGQTVRAGNFEITYLLNQRVTRVTRNSVDMDSVIRSQLTTSVAFDQFRPLDSTYGFGPNFQTTANEIFDAIDTLNSIGEQCVGAILASYFFEYFTLIDQSLRANAQHVLCVPLWGEVLRIVWDWEAKHTGRTIHKGTPYFYMAQAHLLMGNNDQGFVYLSKAVDEDIALAIVCPGFNYPTNAPAYRTACLIDNPGNFMYQFF